MIDFKSKGDDGEEYVNELAYKSYLKYWCYPNPIDINGDKKEICDLLILFRDTAIIISVNNHNFDGNYERYKRKVVKKSTNQLNGAYRKLFNSEKNIIIKHPERKEEIFLPENYRQVFRITINVGEQFEHYELGEQIVKKGFINIFNRDTFEAIIQELDTIKDFVEYLGERERLLLSEKVINFKCQEKDLLAEYLINARKFQLDFNESRLKSNEIILQYMNREIIYSDSLKFHFGNLIYTTRTLVNDGAFETLKSRGLEIITNDSLRQNIISLYSFSVHNLVDFETQDDHRFQFELFVPAVSKALNIETVWESAEPIDRQRLLDNYQFKNAITMNIHIRKYMLSLYRELKISVEMCIREINIELKK